MTAELRNKLLPGASHRNGIVVITSELFGEIAAPIAFPRKFGHFFKVSVFLIGNIRALSECHKQSNSREYRHKHGDVDYTKSFLAFWGNFCFLFDISVFGSFFVLFQINTPLKMPVQERLRCSVDHKNTA